MNMFVALHSPGGRYTFQHVQNEWNKDTNNFHKEISHPIQDISRAELSQTCLQHTHEWTSPGSGSTAQGYIHRCIHTHAPILAPTCPIPCHWSTVFLYKERWSMCVARGTIMRPIMYCVDATQVIVQKLGYRKWL